MTQPVITFIGAGNMAGCIIGGLREKGFPAENIIATRRNQKALSAIEALHGIRVMTDNAAAIELADIVVMGIKPKDMQVVLTSLQQNLQARKPLLVSIAAGTTLEQLAAWSGGQLSIIRAMPNTPSQILAGVTSLYANPLVSQEGRQQVEAIFASVGIVEWLPEEDAIHAYTALAGSGPAYLFLFLEALEKAGQALGIEKKVAERLAEQTVVGAARLAVASDKSAAELREQVTSPNGVTAAALDTLKAQGFDHIISNALANAVKRSREMALGK